MDAPVFDPNQPFEAAPEAPQQAPQVQPQAQPDGSKPQFDPNQPFETQEEHYGSGLQQAGAAVEGLGQGLAGPLFTGAEMLANKLGVPGVKPEDIEGRKEENPWTHGIAEVGGLLSPVGEGALIAGAAGKLVPEVLAGSKIAAGALKGFIEAGLFQGGDEISKAMLGKADPEAPVASALGHMGAAGLFGGALGGAFGAGSSLLSKIGDAKAGSKLSQIAEDFGNRWHNPEATAEAVQNEITDFHHATSDLADEVYGTSGLKQQAIEQTVPEMNSAIANQTQGISDTMTNKLSEMIKDPDSYPPRLVKKFQSMGNKWNEVINNPEATSAQVFEATQAMKKELQFYAKFDKEIKPFDPSYDYVQTAKELSHTLKEHLEDPKVWGEAGDLQKNINKAFTDFMPAQKDFMSKFTEKIGGESRISPNKINTYVNQIGKPHAELKQEMLENYVNAAEKYRDKIADLHHAIGVESPIAPSSLNAVRSTFNGAQTTGSKLADYMRNSAPSALGAAAANATGAGAGAILGGGGGSAAGILLANKLTPFFEKTIGKPISKYGTETILRALSSDSAKSIAEGLNYANQVSRGAQKINKGIANVFKASSQQAVDAHVSDKDREKLKEFIKNGGINQQMKESNYPQAKPHPLQQFAEGGEIMSQPQESASPELPNPADSPLGDIHPEQNMMLATAKGRVSQYLQSQMPQNASKLPYDRPMPDPVKEKSYDQAIDIALQPLSVLNNISEGTLTPEHVQHLNAMYPELHNQLSKKITEQTINQQQDDEMPKYKTRMGLSLFLGQPLDSTMTPANIMAAQPQPKLPPPQQPQGGGKGKGAASKLGKSNKSYQTPTQAAESDRAGRD